VPKGAHTFQTVAGAWVQKIKWYAVTASGSSDEGKCSLTKQEKENITIAEFNSCKFGI